MWREGPGRSRRLVRTRGIDCGVRISNTPRFARTQGVQGQEGWGGQAGLLGYGLGCLGCGRTGGGAGGGGGAGVRHGAGGAQRGADEARPQDAPHRPPQGHPPAPPASPPRKARGTRGPALAAGGGYCRVGKAVRVTVPCAWEGLQGAPAACAYRRRRLCYPRGGAGAGLRRRPRFAGGSKAAAG